MRPTPTRSAARAPLPTDCAESPGRAGPRARRERSRRHPPPGRRAQKSNKDKGRKWYLGVNPAVGVGETATLTTGLLCIPLLLAVAFTLPGNQVLPMVDLITLPSMNIVFACTSNGNILKSTIMAIVWFSLGLFVCSFVGPYYTEVAKGVGVEIPSNALMICSYVILAKPVLGAMFFAFLSGNPLIIAAVAALYFVLYFLFRKNKDAVQDFIERQALMGSEDVEAA